MLIIFLINPDANHICLLIKSKINSIDLKLYSNILP